MTRVCTVLDAEGGVGGAGGNEFRGVKRVPKPVAMVVGRNFPLESRSGSFFLGARFVDRKLKFKPQKRRQIFSNARLAEQKGGKSVYCRR